MNAVVTIGVFDGVHNGHQALVRETIKIAKAENLRPVALTFEPHPMSVIRGMEISALASLERRTELLVNLGIEQVHICDFDSSRASQTPLEFVNEILISQLEAVHVVVGKGFRFGKGASGNSQTLRDAGILVTEVDHVIEMGERVSSTRIRELVAAGDIETANQLLSRKYRFEGFVKPGKQRGRDLGFPTANVIPNFNQAVPADGVYSGWLTNLLTHQTFPAAISVGTNPTFDDVQTRVVEAFAIDQSGLDLYESHVAVDFVSKIRPMTAFGSLEELISAMHKDVEHARIALNL
jgi:riboflavin kinase/FMN adenylyltransferase